MGNGLLLFLLFIGAVGCGNKPTERDVEIIEFFDRYPLALYPVSSNNFRLLLTDAPNPEVSQVWVNIDRVEIKAGSANKKVDITVATDVGMVDLLTLQNKKLLHLNEVTLPENLKISQVRLILKETNNHLIYPNGDRCDLKTPSAQNTGLKISSPEFTIRENEKYSMIIDFDAKKSLVFQGNGDCLLKPVLTWAALRSVPENTVDAGGFSQDRGDDLTDGQGPIENPPVITPIPADCSLIDFDLYNAEKWPTDFTFEDYEDCF